MQVTCSNCGTVYNDGIHLPNVKNATLSNNLSNCPNCGSKNIGPSGVYNFDQYGIGTLLSDPSFDSKTLSELNTVLQTGRANNYSLQQIITNVAYVSAKAALFLSKTLTESNVTFIIDILTFLILLKQEFFNKKDSSKESFITYLKSENQRISNEVERLKRDIALKDAIIASGKTSRNQLCPCGSGKKFKRCHGR